MNQHPTLRMIQAQIVLAESIKTGGVVSVKRSSELTQKLILLLNSKQNTNTWI